MVFTDIDRQQFAAGKHRRAYDVLGAHPADEGTEFAVWAPNAREVSIVGDFNDWQPGTTPLQPSESGIWHGTVRDVGPGSLYKYAIRTPYGDWRQKADPYAFAAEMRPNTASRVADLDTFKWRDGRWMKSRAARNAPSAPLSIYEVHLGSWRRDPGEPDRFLSYRELAAPLVEYVTHMGFTHVELLPIAEHPLDMSWGYQVTGYYAPTARFGEPRDLMYLIDRLHRANIGVILDWVPAHFPKDAHGLARFDGTHLYEHADPRMGEHQDWGTLIFNYGRHEVQSFLISNALFWLDRYHIDGLRVDAVASMLYLDYSRQPGQWVPNRYGGRENLDAIEFLREFNAAVHETARGAITVAEESTAWPQVTGPIEDGGLGFDFKWNMGWMNDTLRYMARDPLYRRFHQNELSFSIWYAFSERYILPLSHDEVVHLKGSIVSKMPGDTWRKFGNARLLYAYMWGHPGKKLLFMGSEFGQWSEWSETRSIDWHLLETEPDADFHRGLQRLVADLNNLLRSHPSLHSLDAEPDGFEWIDFTDADASVLAFRRIARDGSELIFVCNFTPVVREGYRLGLPYEGTYREILNTDAATYGGSGVENTAGLTAEDFPWHGLPYSARCTLPPLAVFVLQRESIDIAQEG